jgi:hypothetical protein
MGYVHCVLPHPTKENLVFLGSDRGLWVSFNRGLKWHKWTQGFPSVPVSDLKFNETFHDLVVGTFGRGVWVFDDVRPLERILSPNLSETLPSAIRIEHITEGYLAQYMSNSGQHYQTADLFGAPNKSTDVRIHIRLDSSLISPKKKIKLVGEIYNEQGERIRKHHFTLDTAGYHVISWRMIRDGVRFPAHGNTQKDSTLPSGMTVAPGRYTIQIRNEGDTLKYKALGYCLVKTSGQTEWNAGFYEEKLRFNAVLNEAISRAYWSFEALKAAEENLKTIQGLHFKTEETKKATLKELKPLSERIETLKLKFMHTEGYRYYEESTVRLNDVLYESHGLLNESSEVTANAKIGVANAQKAADLLCTEVDRFLKDQCNPFIEKVALLPSEIRWVKPVK